MNRFLEHEVEAHARVVTETFAREGAHVAAIGSVLLACFRSGGKALFFGNGGSAADAQHVAAEFMNRFRFDRRPLPAVALTVDTSVLTCIANDASFELVFAKQVEALARRGDVVVGITTSGRSPNVIAGLRAARAVGAVTVGFTGEAGRARMSDVCDHCFAAASDDTARVQEAHELAFHALAGWVERELFPRGA